MFRNSFYIVATVIVTMAAVSVGLLWNHFKNVEAEVSLQQIPVVQQAEHEEKSEEVNHGHSGASVINNKLLTESQDEVVTDGVYLNKTYHYQIVLPSLFSTYTIKSQKNTDSESPYFIENQLYVVSALGTEWSGPDFDAFVISVFDRTWWEQHVRVDKDGTAWEKDYPDDLSMGVYLGSSDKYAFKANRGQDCPGKRVEGGMSTDNTPHCELYFNVPKILQSFKIVSQ